MAKLTFYEFIQLSTEEQIKRYADLSGHDQFRARMNNWSAKSTTVQEPELTPELIEMRKKDDELLEKFISENYDENGKLIDFESSR